MEETNFIEIVTERDVDLLILEELYASSNFRAWLVRLTYGDGHEPIRFDGAWHSLSHATLGESDLAFTFYSPNEEKCAVLIENKIDAPPQPEQGERYKARGKAGIEDGDWDRFKTCILAPQSYLSRRTDVQAYDVQISYKGIRDWFQQNLTDAERSRYKCRLLLEADEQNRRGYTPKMDEHVTRFWRSYWLCASREFPELSMREPGEKPAKATWIYFRMKKVGQNRQIIHKLDAGFVDLEIANAGTFVDALKSKHGSLLDQDSDIVRTGRSASIRVQVPKVDLSLEFESQLGNVRAGLRAAYRLLYLSRAISAELAPIDTPPVANEHKATET